MKIITIMKKLYLQPIISQQMINAKSIICQSVHVDNDEGESMTGGAPMRKINVMYI